MMENKTGAGAPEVPDEKSCRHHWIIEPASGPTSVGVCKHCGAVKEFQNYWHGSSWERDLPKALQIPVSVPRDVDDRDDY